MKNNVDPKMIEATLSTKRDDSTLVRLHDVNLFVVNTIFFHGKYLQVRKVVPIGKCPKVNTSVSQSLHTSTLRF